MEFRRRIAEANVRFQRRNGLRRKTEKVIGKDPGSNPGAITRVLGCHFLGGEISELGLWIREFSLNDRNSERIRDAGEEKWMCIGRK